MVDPLAIAGLICFWNFQEPGGQPRVAQGPHPYALLEQHGPIQRVEDGLFGTGAARLQPGQNFSIPRADCPALDIHGPEAQVSLIVWLRRRVSAGKGCQAVAGMWNEYQRRQYCLFLNLRIWDSAEQVGAHVSSIGGATPGYRYCMDAAIGATPVPFDTWQCVAMSYDGAYARAWLNGRLDERGDRNPYRYEGGLFDPGERGADFTVGAVARPDNVDAPRTAGEDIGNQYHGDLAGLAVFDRALTADEMATLAGDLVR